MKLHRAWDRLLQFLVFNEEFLVNASHQLALITSLPFVHTARRSYRLDESMSLSESGRETTSVVERLPKVMQICSSRGRRSRNKVSVGEPAEGSLTQNNPKNQRYFSPTSVLAIRHSEIRGGSHNFPASGGRRQLRALGGGDFLSRPNPSNRSLKCAWCLHPHENSISTPLNGGSLGSGDDEERSEMRYVM